MSVENDKQLVSLTKDLEFSGSLNRSAGQGAKFSLMLAMLAENMLTRPTFIHEQSTASGSESEPALASFYPKHYLKPKAHSWLNLNRTSQLLQDNLRDAQLWQTMHPEPLSLYNDNLRLADEVVENCGYHTQAKLADAKELSANIEPDETGLYEILQSLQEQPLLS